MTSHTSRACLYTVLNNLGSVQERSCTVATAAKVVMTYDGGIFEIRASGDGSGFELWIGRLLWNEYAEECQLHKSVLFSLLNDRTSAESQIYREVLRRADIWKGCSVMRDVDYEQDA